MCGPLRQALVPPSPSQHVLVPSSRPALVPPTWHTLVLPVRKQSSAVSFSARLCVFFSEDSSGEKEKETKMKAKGPVR